MLRVPRAPIRIAKDDGQRFLVVVSNEVLPQSAGRMPHALPEPATGSPRWWATIDSSNAVGIESLCLRGCECSNPDQTTSKPWKNTNHRHSGLANVIAVSWPPQT